jgi:hypothetical protein
MENERWVADDIFVASLPSVTGRTAVDDRRMIAFSQTATSVNDFGELRKPKYPSVRAFQSAFQSAFQVSVLQGHEELAAGIRDKT